MCSALLLALSHKVRKETKASRTGRRLETPSRKLASNESQRKAKVVERKVIDPWTWQDQFGFVQATEVSAVVQRTIFCAGQTSNETKQRT